MKLGYGAVFIMIMLAGCVNFPAAKPAIKTYDLGIPQRQGDVLQSTGFYLNVVTAPEVIDSTDMLYRLMYDDPNRISSYTESRWRMSPAQLVTNRLMEATGVPVRGRTQQMILGSCAIDVRMAAFEQRFLSPHQGQAVMDWTVDVTDSQTRERLASKRFTGTAMMVSPNASGGVGALSQVANAVIGETSTWLKTEVLAVYPGCGQMPTPRKPRLN